MANSPDLGIPYVPSPPPAQAEVLHNEALNMLIALQKGAIDRGLNTPPGSPADGDVYILGAAPTGAWAGKANKIAIRTSTAWTFVPGNDSDGANIPIGARHEGLRIWVQDEDALYVWSGSAWTASTVAAANVSNVPAGNIAATTVQAAINELDGEKVSKAGDTMTGQLAITVTGANNLILSGQGATAFVGDRYSSDISAPNFAVRKARGTIAAPSAVLVNDQTGVVSMQGYDGAAFRSSVVQLGTVVAPTPSATDMESMWTLSMPAAGSGSLTEVLRARTSTGLNMFGANPVIDQNRLHRLRQYTVATLPTVGTAGRLAGVTDASAPTYNATVAGGGAVNIPVYDNGSNWTCH